MSTFTNCWLLLGAECWGVGFFLGYSGDDCWMFLSVDPEACLNNYFINSNIDMYLKTCFIRMYSPTCSMNWFILFTFRYYHPFVLLFKTKASLIDENVDRLNVNKARSCEKTNLAHIIRNISRRGGLKIVLKIQTKVIILNMFFSRVTSLFSCVKKTIIQMVRKPIELIFVEKQIIIFAKKRVTFAK